MPIARENRQQPQPAIKLVAALVSDKIITRNLLNPILRKLHLRQFGAKEINGLPTKFAVHNYLTWILLVVDCRPFFGNSFDFKKLVERTS